MLTLLQSLCNMHCLFLPPAPPPPGWPLQWMPWWRSVSFSPCPSSLPASSSTSSRSVWPRPNTCSLSAGWARWCTGWPTSSGTWWVQHWTAVAGLGLSGDWLCVSLPGELLLQRRHGGRHFHGVWQKMLHVAIQLACADHATTALRVRLLF